MTAVDLERLMLLELLGAAARPEAELRELARSVAWDEVLTLAGRNLHPLLASRVAQRGVPVPEVVRHELQQARRANALIVAQRRAAIRQVAEALDRAAIPFVVLKGLALAHQVYPSPETRVMSDVDLWLGGAPIGPAVRTLEPLGWQRPWWRRTEGLTNTDHVALRLRSTALLIELHPCPGSIMKLSPGALDAMWARRVPADFGGFACHTLAREDLLIHLCLHLAGLHRFVAAVPRLVDVTQLVSATDPGLDWSIVVDRCLDLGIAGWVATTLETARRMLNAPVPRDALQGLAVPDLDRLATMACEQAWLSDRTAVAPGTVLASSGATRRTKVLMIRLRDLLLGDRSRPAPWASRPEQLFNRLRFAAQVRLPAVARALARGTFRGPKGARLQATSAGNQALFEAMLDRSPGSQPRPES